MQITLSEKEPVFTLGQDISVLNTEIKWVRVVVVPLCSYELTMQLGQHELLLTKYVFDTKSEMYPNFFGLPVGWIIIQLHLTTCVMASTTESVQ